MQTALSDSITPPGTPAGPTDARLRAYAALLARWTSRINLISRGDEPHIWTRHVLDSLRLVPLVPTDVTRAIDLGSGAGLPGLVLAVATGIHVDLVESDRRKAAFLQEAQRVTAAPVTIHCARAETLRLPPARLVTARALAPLETLLGYAAPFLAPGGTCLFPKGARAAEEIAAARLQWRFECEQAGSAESPVLIVTRVERA